MMNLLEIQDNKNIQNSIEMDNYFVNELKKK